jgi:hypothetical protein
MFRLATRQSEFEYPIPIDTDEDNDNDDAECIFRCCFFVQQNVGSTGSSVHSPKVGSL